MTVLTELGFRRPTYDELLNEQIQRAKDLFGEDLDTDEKTAIGKFIRIQVYDLSKVYEELEAIYYARFPNTARGINLDRLCVFAGISRNPPTSAIHRIKIFGTPGYTVPMGFLVSTASYLDFYTEQDVEIGEGGTAEISVICEQRGIVGNVAVGEITEIVNPDAQVEKIEHLALEEAGADRETDTALRARFQASISGSGGATVDSIRGEIMRVTNVSRCLIEENATDSTDASGRPPRSFECFVDAPESANQEIAQAIFRKKPIGIKSHGKVFAMALDDTGAEHKIWFTKFQNVPIYMKVKIKTDRFFQSDGIQEIKNNLANAVNNFGEGNALVRSSLYCQIYPITGVTEVTELLLSTDGETYAAQNISVAVSEKLLTDPEQIQIEVIGA